MNQKLKSVGVHDGTFHADEVSACALLQLFGLIDEGNIVRTRNYEILDTCEYVCDVGGIYDPAKKRFDHHQTEYRGDLSSAGMVLLYLKDQKIITESIYSYLNRALIIGVDAHDNGKVTSEIGHCSFSGVISNYVPVRHDAPASEMLSAFHEAVAFTHGHLKRLIEKYYYIAVCKKEVEKAMAEGKHCLYFEASMPWLDSFFQLGGENHPALFLIMPAGEHWKLRTIPPNLKDRMNVRMPLPENWAGLLEKDLEKVSGIPGAIFCHKGRFISIWETKEAAEKALKYVLNTESLS